jgi:hypothetical protein
VFSLWDYVPTVVGFASDLTHWDVAMEKSDDGDVQVVAVRWHMEADGDAVADL